MSEKIHVQPPEQEPAPKVSKPPTKAAGMKAIGVTMKHVAQYMKPAEALRLSLAVNQKSGFDCPGCAWPDPDDERSSIGEYCENGMKAIAEERTKNRIGADFFKQYSVAELSKLSDFDLGKKGRLTEPMVLRAGSTHYEPITWDDAFSLLGKELNALNDPNEAIFYTSGRTSNEAAFLYQLFARAYGTNNLPDCSNMCHESSGVALSETVGIGKGSVTLNDLHEAEVIMIMGQNPGTNHPRMLSALEKCKENGGKIIAVNPLPEAGLLGFVDPQSPTRVFTNGVELSDLYLPIRINGDVAFLKALMKLLFQKEEEKNGKVVDWDFVEEYTEGLDALRADLEQYELDDLIAATGLERSDIEQAAKMLARTQRIIICWAMGLTQHENAVDNIREVVNLLLMKGAIGKPGAGTCPVRGHSNVQGDRTMGIWHEAKEAFVSKLDAYFGIKSPREEGYSVVPAIEAMHSGAAKVFFAMGGNFLSATPDTEYTAEALQNCSLTAHVSTKLNRSHLVHGKTALILPCLGRTDIDMQATGEQFVSVENSMGVVHQSRGVLPTISEHLLSEPAIVAGMAKATLQSGHSIEWDALVRNYDHIREAIEATIVGFENYNRRVRQPGGFYLPNGARERNFKTDTGKAKFTVNRLGNAEKAEGEYFMMTVRSHDQYNTTIYGLNDRYRGIDSGRRVILMSEQDMQREGLRELDMVHLHSEYKGKKRSVRNFRVVPYPIPVNCTATYFPEANPLVPIDSYARKSHTPCSKLVRITIEKA